MKNLLKTLLFILSTAPLAHATYEEELEQTRAMRVQTLKQEFHKSDRRLNQTPSTLEEKEAYLDALKGFVQENYKLDIANFPGTIFHNVIKGGKTYGILMEENGSFEESLNNILYFIVNKELETAQALTSNRQDESL